MRAKVPVDCDFLLAVVAFLHELMKRLHPLLRFLLVGRRAWGMFLVVTHLQLLCDRRQGSTIREANHTTVSPVLHHGRLLQAARQAFETLVQSRSER